MFSNAKLFVTLIFLRAKITFRVLEGKSPIWLQWAYTSQDTGKRKLRLLGTQSILIPVINTMLPDLCTAELQNFLLLTGRKEFSSENNFLKSISLFIYVYPYEEFSLSTNLVPCQNRFDFIPLLKPRPSFKSTTASQKFYCCKFVIHQSHIYSLNVPLQLQEQCYFYSE